MRIKYIDVLKAVAIIGVVLYHVGLMTYGYLGVDIFLVAAGFLTTKSLYAKNLSIKGYLNFEISRVIRLLPPLLIAGAVCMIAGFWLMLPDDYENLSESVVATNFFANNILSAITTKNYWDVVNEYKPLMHTWYVGVVMQFYIVYPILFIIAQLDKAATKKTLLTMVSFLTVASLLIYFGTTNDTGRFYYLPSRFFEFGVGGVAALLYNPKDKPFGKWFVYICYAILLLLLVIEYEMVPAVIRLVMVVALTVVLMCSQHVLENNITGNATLAKIGAASYSIFIWHQVLLAFCRYSITSDFTIATYVGLLFSTALLSWLSYKFIEQLARKALKTKKSKTILYTTTLLVFLIVTAWAAYIYRQGGVVRDVPELYITKGGKSDHKAYNDKIYNLDKPFETDKKHWLVVGNSFGRDFANVILESEVADSIELSYIYIENYKKPEYSNRFASADRVFLSSFGADEETVSGIEMVCKTNGFNIDDLVIVGTKNFGVSNGQFYINRNNTDYFQQRTMMEKCYYDENSKNKALFGERYLDLIGLVLDKNNTMPVFTPDHHYISQDCRHFSEGGARWFSTLIDWSRYF